MIKIIKPGYTEKVATCKTCGCVYQFDLSDFDVCTINNTKHVTLICPTCNESQLIKADQL